jgi:Tol biopolymer transport system component
LADTQGSAAQRLTASTADENFPAVSPGGDKIAFTAEGADFDLLEIPLNGSAARPLLVTSRNETDPSWSPTQPEFAYVTDRTGRSQIWLRSRDGQWERPLVTENDFAKDSTRLFAAPAFSADGRRIAYNRFGTDGNKIWVSSLAGGPPSRLTTSIWREESPTWSPDGNSIAYIQGTLGHYALARARIGVQEPPVVVRDDVLLSSRPQWSPRGDWIACDNADGLFVVSPDGKAIRSLGEQAWLGYDWAEDGAHIFGIRASDDARSLLLASIDVRTGNEQTITPNLGPVPLASQPIRGFSRTSARSFATSVVRVWSDIWLLEGFQSPVSLIDRFWPKRQGRGR